MELAVNVAGSIRGFIETEILFEDKSVELNADTPLLNGIMDSLGLMQLVAFLEEEFDIEIDDGEITKEHFSTMGQIERLVATRISDS